MLISFVRQKKVLRLKVQELLIISQQARFANMRASTSRASLFRTRAYCILARLAVQNNEKTNNNLLSGVGMSHQTSFMTSEARRSGVRSHGGWATTLTRSGVRPSRLLPTPPRSRLGVLETTHRRSAQHVKVKIQRTGEHRFFGHHLCFFFSWPSGHTHVS